MESVLVAILVALVVWLLLRHARLMRARGASPPTATMPRIGTPGTATAEQLERMRQYHFETSASWSREEAALILDAVDFLRAALREAARRDDAPLETQNRLLVFLLSDEALRGHVVQWAQARRRGARGACALDGPDGARVAGFIRELG